MDGDSKHWKCEACGRADNTGQFCMDCGRPRPVEASKPAQGWTCSCGKAGNTGKFCISCGAARPEQPEGWICSRCGTENKTGKFCLKCGAPKEAGAVPAAAVPAGNAAPAAQGYTPGVGQAVTPAVPAAPLHTAPAPKTPMSKNTKGILVVLVLLVVAYFGYGMVIEKLYDSKCEEFITLSSEVHKNIEAVADLDGDSDAEETKRIAEQFAAESAKLAEIHDSLAGKTPPDAVKLQHDKLLSVIERDQEVLTKAGEVLQYDERVTTQKAQKEYGEVYKGFRSALQKLNSAADGVTVKGREVKSVLAYDSFDANIKGYIDKKLAKDHQYVAARLKEYQEKLRAANEEAKTKNEVVFLPERVQKAGADLLVYGRFYNGTNDVVTGIKEMLVDAALNSYDKEVAGFKDFAYSDVHLEAMMMQPKGTSWPVILRLAGKAPEDAYNNFTVQVHKIRWSVRRLVQR